MSRVYIKNQVSKFIINYIAAIVLATTISPSPAKAQFPHSIYECVSPYHPLVRKETDAFLEWEVAPMVEFIKKHQHLEPRDISIVLEEEENAECLNDALKKIRINGSTYQFVKDGEKIEWGEKHLIYRLQIVHQ